MTVLNQLRKVLKVCLLALGVFGCSSNGSDPDPINNAKDRELILTHWADNIIIPSYDNFKVKLDLMLAKGNTFATARDNASLLEFRSAWVDAYAEWQKAELFEFGPADKYTLRNFYNIYPADVGGITANISDPAANLELPSAYPRQGFPALDYLLNGVGNNDAAILDYYTTGPDASKRADYIKKIITRMNILLTNVITEWNGAYRSTFISKTGLDIGSSMGLVVNAYVLYFERYVRSGKFGIPSGAAIASSGVPNPDKLEAFYKKDISLTLAKNANNAVMDFFNGVAVETGAEGPSFKSYLDALEAKDSSTGTLLSSIINEQFDVINAKLDLLSPNLYEEILTNNQAMIDVYTEMQKMVRMLKVDMTSALSVTITYTDNDGD
jgi:predicted lipoprotein